MKKPNLEALQTEVELGSAESVAPDAFLLSALNEVEPALIILSDSL